MIEHNAQLLPPRVPLRHAAQDLQLTGVHAAFFPIPI